ncbi:MAG: DUF362 domain-containing protein [Deltaproteobacteria bacterium]|nr:DUF362 domain-containing protein [Deltaproteobacteria bacterium]
MTECRKNRRNRRLLTRRQFIKSTVAGAAAVYVAPTMVFGAGLYGSGTKSRVVRVVHPGLIDMNERIQKKPARQCVDEALLMLTKEKEVRDAWMQIFPDLKAQDVIGLKVNSISTKCPTHPEIAYAIVDSLIEATGMDPNRIIIWDRSTAELKRVGYTINQSDKGIRCFGTVKSFSGIRWIMNRKQDESGGVGYDKSQPIDMGMDLTSNLSGILTRMCTHLINVPVLKDHRIAGVTLALKNHFGTIDNPRDCHDNFCDPFAAKLNAASHIKDKTKLIICDAAYGVYEGGPRGAPQWKPKAILASTDPVALDYTGMQIINAQRKKNDLEPITDMAVHIKTAQDLGLGTCDPKQIQLKESALG